MAKKKNKKSENTDNGNDENHVILESFDHNLGASSEETTVATSSNGVSPSQGPLAHTPKSVTTDAKTLHLALLIKQVKDEVFQLRVEFGCMEKKLLLAAAGGACIGAAMASIIYLRFQRNHA
uniref:Uncharacterized protein n=1 Tax=Polyblepharides amylifera TaxID=1486889 RepID=A0A7R9SUX2_9CHLO